MPNFLQFTGTFIDAIRINRMNQQERDGKVYWVKTRRPASPFIIGCANRFFRVVENPVVVCAPVAHWQAWEVDSFNLLHSSEGFHANAEPPATVRADRLPGVPLHLQALAGTLNAAMLRAAGRELRRAHALFSPAIGALWSHGDPHLGNFLYDSLTDRARLIDFEVYHRPGMAVEERHTDDLLVMLQDLMGRDDFALWQNRVEWFLDGYGVPPTMLERLCSRLREPRGIKRLWWAIRTAYLPRAERRRRIAALRERCREEKPAAPVVVVCP